MRLVHKASGSSCPLSSPRPQKPSLIAQALPGGALSCQYRRAGYAGARNKVETHRNAPAPATGRRDRERRWPTLTTHSQTPPSPSVRALRDAETAQGTRYRRGSAPAAPLPCLLQAPPHQRPLLAGFRPSTAPPKGPRGPASSQEALGSEFLEPPEWRPLIPSPMFPHVPPCRSQEQLQGY